MSYEDIVTRIFNFIGATRFLVDVICVRKLNGAKENESYSTPNGDTAVLTSFSLILRFKSVQVRNEVMRLKILKGNIPVVSIFPNLPDLAENKVFLNEFLAELTLPADIFSELKNIHFCESYGSLKLNKEKALKIGKNLLLHFC